MKRGYADRRRGAADPFPTGSKKLATHLTALCSRLDTPELIACVADAHARVLLCKALVCPASEADHRLERRAAMLLRLRGVDVDMFVNRLRPVACALGLVSERDWQIDYYVVLGARPGASAADIRAAYRKKAFAHHPDVARGGDAMDFVQIKNAYDTLKDPQKRAAFDRCRQNYWVESDAAKRINKPNPAMSGARLWKVGFRIAVVVAVMLTAAWAMSLLYEQNVMLELVDAPGPAPAPLPTAYSVGH